MTRRWRLGYLGRAVAAMAALAMLAWVQVHAPEKVIEPTVHLTGRLAELTFADLQVREYLNDQQRCTDTWRSMAREARGTIDGAADTLRAPPAWLEPGLTSAYQAAFDEFQELHQARETLFSSIDDAWRRGDQAGCQRLTRMALELPTASPLATLRDLFERHVDRTVVRLRHLRWALSGLAFLLLFPLLAPPGRRDLSLGNLTPVLSSAFDPVLVLDRHGAVRAANPAGIQLFGSRARPGTPDAAGQIVLEDSRSRWIERIQAAREERGDGEQVTEEVTLLLEDGTPFPARCSMVAVDTEGERVVVVHIRDLRPEQAIAELEETLRTNTRQLTQKELELQITQARKAAIFSASLDCIVGLDSEWKVIEWNQATVTTFGYSDDELKGVPFDRLVHASISSDACRNGSSPAAEDASSAVECPVGERFETCAERRDGTMFPAEVSVVQVEVPGPPLFTAYITDITERKNVEHIKNEFISIVSHELRTPLTSIRGSLGLLEGGVAGPIEGKVRELVHIARSNSDRLIRLVNDMLDLEKMQSGKDELRMEPVHPQELVDAARAAVEGMAEEAGVRIVQRTVTGPVLEGDKDRLVQAVTNLLSNAVKASPEGAEVVVEGRIQSDGTFALSVTDSGPGIPPDQMPRLFNQFQRLDNPAFRKKRGTGLGLAITKTIMNRHGGTIEVESTVGQGSTFTLVMPVSGGDDSGARGVQGSASKGSRGGRPEGGTEREEQVRDEG